MLWFPSSTMYEYFFNYHTVFGNEVIGNALQCNEVSSKEVKKVGRLSNSYTFTHFGKIKKKIQCFYICTSQILRVFLWRIFDLELRWNTILIKEDIQIKRKPYKYKIHDNTCNCNTGI